MNHAITIGGLLCFVGALGGIAMVGFGLLAAFAGGMSDNIEEGGKYGRQGCSIMLVGAVILAACLWGML